MNDDNISSKLSSTLPNYSSWPNNIKQDLIRLIKNTQMISAKEIKDKIKDEYVGIDKILKKLAGIQKTFKKDNDENYLSNDNVLYKDINQIYNSIKKSKGKKKDLTKEDIKKIKEAQNQQKMDYLDISPYLSDNTGLIFDSILLLISQKIYPSDPINEEDALYQLKNICLDDWDDNFDFDIDILDDEQNGNVIGDEFKELKEWVEVGKNFLTCVYRGYQMFQTINLSKKIIKENKYRTKLNEISDKLSEYQNSKRLYENDPIENVAILKQSIDKISEIRDNLLNLIEELKKEIDQNLNKKRGNIGNIIYQIIKIGENIVNLAVTKDPSKFINILSIGFEISTIVFCGIDISYTNDILDELIKLLKEAKQKQKKVEEEIKSLHQKYSEIKKAYPTRY